MSVPTMQVENYRYPFALSTRSEAKVVELQYFKSLEELQ